VVSAVKVAPRRLAMALVLALVCTIMYAVGASSASAAVPSWSAQCANDLDVAACERLTFIAETDDAVLARLNGTVDVASSTADRSLLADASNSLHGDLWVVVGAIAAAAVGGAFLNAVLWR
jgi:hypothetical protein